MEKDRKEVGKGVRRGLKRRGYYMSLKEDSVTLGCLLACYTPLL